MIVESPTTIGARIRAWREGRGLTLRAFADAVGIDRKLVSKYETGARLPSRKTVERLRRVIGDEI